MGHLLFMFQDVPLEPASTGWQYFVALLLNSFAIVVAVQLLKVWVPILREKVPWLFPIIAMVIGPLMAMATSAVSGYLGYPVDFGSIAAIFTGGSAVAFHQVYTQFQKAA